MFDLCKQQCKGMIKKDRRAHLKSVESKLLKNPRYHSKYARSHSGNNNRPEISLLNSVSRPDAGVSDAFAILFASVNDLRAANYAPCKLVRGRYLRNFIVVGEEITESVERN